MSKPIRALLILLYAGLTGSVLYLLTIAWITFPEGGAALTIMVCLVSIGLILANHE